jgi:diaminopimelate decarboxylase
LSGTEESFANIPAESGLSINGRGHLTIEGHDAVDLARKFGTPLWVVSENTIRNNFRAFKAAFERKYPKVIVVYASKANHAPAILRIAVQEGAWVDVVSLGHVRLAEKGRVPPGKIVFNGNNKSKMELETAVRMGVGHINVDSLDELELLGKVCNELKKVARINLRIRPGMASRAEIDPDFVSQATSHKFGLDVPSGQAFECFRRALEMKFIEVHGISHHIGWTAYNIPYDKELDLARIKTEVEEVTEFARLLQERLNFKPRLLDLGGGYRKQRPHGFGPNRIASYPTVEEYADTILGVLNDAASWIGQPTVMLEPGAYMVADAVTMLSSVGAIKSVNSGLGAGKWVAVDSSAYFFVRKLIFNFYHHTVIANKALQASSEVVDIVGKTCAYDYIADKTCVPSLERGDIVATLDQGAYCETISTQYCAIPRPATVLVSKEQVDLIKRRETIEDILSQYTIPSWLD